MGNILTFSGRVIDPLDPDPKQIVIEDIAHALSLQCRYGGHCKRFYSVAEHSVLIWRYIWYHVNKKSALLHDAAEAYLVDVPSPVKDSIPQYASIEDNLSRIIAKKFGAIYPWPHEVHVLDESITIDERDQNLAKPRRPGADWPDRRALGIQLCYYSPDMAEATFLRAFYE